MATAVVYENGRVLRDDVTTLPFGSTDTLHDYDLVYIYPSVHWRSNNVDWSARVHDLLTAGKTVVVFCNGQINNCIHLIYPFGALFNEGSGTKIEHYPNVAFKKFYDKHIHKYEQYLNILNTQFNHEFIPLLGINDSKIIAFKHRERSLYFLSNIQPHEFFGPADGNPEKALAEIIMPSISNSQAAPSWANAAEFTPNKVAAIVSEIAKLTDAIEEAKRKIGDLENEKEELERWRVLLFGGDTALENMVSSALELLGAEVLPPFNDGTNELEHVFKIQDKTLVGDSKGKTKALIKDDISQLRTNANAYESANELILDGKIIFLNHYRGSEPSTRSTPADQNLIDLAKMFKIKIILTVDIFVLVKRLLDGDRTAKDAAATLLLSSEFGLMKIDDAAAVTDRDNPIALATP